MPACTGRVVPSPSRILTLVRTLFLPLPLISPLPRIRPPIWQQRIVTSCCAGFAPSVKPSSPASAGDRPSTSTSFDQPPAQPRRSPCMSAMTARWQVSRRSVLQLRCIDVVPVVSPRSSCCCCLGLSLRSLSCRPPSLLLLAGACTRCARHHRSAGPILVTGAVCISCARRDDAPSARARHRRHSTTCTRADRGRRRRHFTRACHRRRTSGETMPGGAAPTTRLDPACARAERQQQLANRPRSRATLPGSL